MFIVILMKQQVLIRNQSCDCLVTDNHMTKDVITSNLLIYYKFVQFDPSTETYYSKERKNILNRIN